MSQITSASIKLETPVTGRSSISLQPTEEGELQDNLHARPITRSDQIPAVKGALMIALLSTASLISTVTTGLLTTSIPRMATELGIRPQESYWPTSVYGLTSGAFLMLAGAVADVAGSKRVFLVGCFVMAAFGLVCGFVKAGEQLVAFRALQGVGNAMCLPTTMGVLTASFPAGRRRNIGIACTGLAQPLGFSVGLVFGGVFLDTIGWRFGWYISAGILFVTVPAGAWLLPRDRLAQQPSVRVFRTKIDWVGTGIACACTALLALGLLEVSASGTTSSAQPIVIAPVACSLLLIPVFGWWMGFAEKKGRPVLIPNRLWNKPFAGICIIILLSYAVLQTMDLFMPLYFQNIQKLSALKASLQLLPSFVVGVLCNIFTGSLVHRARPLHLILVSSALCAGAPLLMALINRNWPYWYAAFPAQILQPISVDVLFCVGLIVISEMFPDDTQALAGAVFNTASQMGNAVGLAVIGVIADRVTQSSRYDDKTSLAALEVGYKAGFWACFAFTLATCVVAAGSMRRIGRVGVKRS